VKAAFYLYFVEGGVDVSHSFSQISTGIARVKPRNNSFSQISTRIARVEPPNNSGEDDDDDDSNSDDESEIDDDNVAKLTGEVKKNATAEECELKKELTKLSEEMKKETEQWQHEKRRLVIEVAKRACAPGVANKRAKKAAGRETSVRSAQEKSQENMMDGGASTPEIYRRRNANIARNEGKLRELGLLDKPTEVEKKRKEKKTEEDNSSDNNSTVDDGDDGDDDSGSEEQEEVVEELDSEEEIMEIVNKRRKGDKDHLQVKWKNGQYTWEPAELLKIDVPEMVGKFYENRMQETANTPRKAWVEFTVETVGGCLSSEHNSSEMFLIEEDARYWNEGLSFYGVRCGKCDGDSRPCHRYPAYRCTHWNTRGCLEVRCCACYSAMLTSEDSVGASRCRRKR
jgi:hypothetical protein